jgi:hypothetical protein
MRVASRVMDTAVPTNIMIVAGSTGATVLWGMKRFTRQAMGMFVPADTMSPVTKVRRKFSGWRRALNQM